MRSLSQRKTRLPKTKSPEEWQRFFEAINTRYDTAKRNYALLYLMYVSALRVGEALALNVDDLDLVLLRVHVRDGKSGERMVPLRPNDRLRESMEAWLEVRERWNPPNPLLFVTKPGKPLSTNAVRQSVTVYGERAGLGHVTPHMLRHSAATEMLANGAPPIGVQRVLGHKRLATTLNEYAWASDTHAAEAMAKRHIDW